MAREIGSLISNTVLDAVRDREKALAKARRESPDFEGTEDRSAAVPSDGLNDRAPVVKIVLSLREEYLGALQELTLDIPQLFQNRFRLFAFSASQASDAIRRPARAFGAFDTPPFEYAGDAIDAMLGFLRGGSGQIESWELQLLCSHIERHVVPNLLHAREPSADPPVVTTDLLGGSDAMQRVLSTFFEEELGKLPLRERGRARELCDTGCPLAWDEER